MTATAEVAFVNVVQHLKLAVEDVEEIGATKEVIAQLQVEIVNLFKKIMKEAEVESVGIPSSLYKHLTQMKLSEEDGVVFDRTGILHVKSGKGSEVRELQDYPTDTVINIFNAVAPILKEEVGRARKAHENRLETLQALKSSLAALEKK
ncbi:MAG: hypothetical protein HYU39_09415 [Thaumarchaeota archaeon]|nr:hypothetical protein [Nitrososphaerota archaeon]